MLLDEIADYLSSQGSTTDGTPLLVSYLPPDPDQVAVVYETGGYAPVRAMTGTLGQIVEERPSIQIMVRGSANGTDSGYKSARLKAETIWGLLDNLGDRTINGVRYFQIYSKQKPFMMGRDEQQRPLISCNYDIWKARSTS